MRQALTMDVLATDLADYLVRKGVGGFGLNIRVCKLINYRPFTGSFP